MISFLISSLNLYFALIMKKGMSYKYCKDLILWFTLKGGWLNMRWKLTSNTDNLFAAMAAKEKL